MKHENVLVGHVYAVKVGDRIRPVTITQVLTTTAYGTRAGMLKTPRRMQKFLGRNEVTGRTIGPFTAAKCRHEVVRLDSGVWARADVSHTGAA